jgi:hypothetical protein
VIPIAAELKVAALECDEFSTAQPRTHCHQQQGIVLRANLLSGLQELLNLIGRERDAFGFGRLCGTRETAQTGRRIRFKEFLLNCLI